MIREGRTARAAATVVMLAALLAGCSGSGDGDADDGATRYPDAPALDLRGALALVPNGVGRVDYTHWAALGHGRADYSTTTLTSSWVRKAAEFEQAVGVAPAAADWQLTIGGFASGEREETITQWTDGAALGRLVDSLRAHGWRGDERDSELLLRRDAPLEDDGWQWARADDFAIDAERGVVRQFPRGGEPRRPGPQSLLNRRGVRAAVAASPAPVTGELRSGGDYVVCPQYGLVQKLSYVSKAYAAPIIRAVGRLRPVDAVNFVISDPAGRAGSVAVALPSAEQALVELAPRRAAHAILAPGLREYSITGARRTGAVDVFTFRGDQPLDGHGLLQDQDLGVDSCGLN